MEISKIASAPIRSPRPWTVLGHIDATAPDLEPYEMQRIAALDTIDKSNTNVVLDVRHAPVNRTAKIAKAALATASAPVLALGGLIAGAAIVASGGALLPAVLVAGGGALEGALLASTSRSGYAQLRRLQWEPQNEGTAWKGTRTMELGSTRGAPATVLGEIASTKAPEGKTLGSFLATNMKQYPAQRYAVILGGHGRARSGVGDISVDDMAQAMSTAHRETGRKVDALMLDSCLVGNFETLLPMSGDVRYAVVSEEPLYTGVFDWTSIINALQDRRPSAQDFGHLALHYSQYSRSPRTVSVVDMGMLPGLKGSLERLGESLNQAIDAGHRGAISKAFSAATKIQDMGAMERKTENKLDLGNLLEQLADVPDPAVQAAVADARRAYQAAVPSHGASEQFSTTTGLSIQGPLAWHNESGYAKETGMPQWSRLLGNMRPLPLRIFHTAVEKTRSLFGGGHAS